MMEDNVPGFPGYHVTRSGNVIEGSYHKLPGLRISYYNI